MNEPVTKRSFFTDAQNNLSVAVRYLSYLNPLTIHKKGRRVKAYFALALVCFFWGTTWIASREAVRAMHSPLQVAGIRQSIGGLLYVAFFLFKGAALPKGREWGPILVLSFLNFMLSNALSTWGVKYISAGLGSVIGSIFPLWLVLIGLFGGGEKIARKAVIGLLMGFAGICVIFREHLADFVDPKFQLGIALSVASTWSWAFGTIYTKRHAVHFNPYFGLGLQMLISGLTLMGVSAAAGDAMPISEVPLRTWGAIAYLVVFGSVISFIAFLYALQNLSTEQASLYAYINPIVAVLCGALFLGEHLTTALIIGVGITLFGVYLVNKARKG